VQAQQDLKPMRVGEQVEALGPAGGVDIGQGRRHTFGVRLVTGLDHASNLNPDDRTDLHSLRMWPM
jgi:hypothetical protein